MHKRFELTPAVGESFPLFIESMGHHEDQEKIKRDEGYPCYHWLQTFSGEGEFWLEDKSFRMNRGSGILFLPGTPHAYWAVTDRWCTQYITFGGKLADAILNTLGLYESALFRWEERSPLHTSVERMIGQAETGSEYTGYDASSDLYAFLTILKKHGQVNNRASITSRIMQLQPLLDWLELHYHNPDIGLENMAVVLGVTPRHMHTLFQHAFGLSPYAYFILLRLRKSKEMLLSQQYMTVKDVAEHAGFRDASHFVASFRKHVGLTPERFRQMN